MLLFWKKQNKTKKTYPGCDTPQHNQRTWKSEMGGRRTRKRRFNTGRAPTTGPASEPPVDWEASAVAAILPSDGSRPVPGENDGAGRRGQLAGRRGPVERRAEWRVALYLGPSAGRGAERRGPETADRREDVLAPFPRRQNHPAFLLQIRLRTVLSDFFVP